MTAAFSQQTALAGCTVVLTRPAHQQQPLKSDIESLGARVISFPTLSIGSVADESTRSRVRLMATADVVVFVSPNAVWHGVPLIRELIGWPERALVAAVGPATADALAEAGLTVGIAPDSGQGSRALLGLAAFRSEAVRRLKVFVVKGRGGLSVLADTLTEREADVTEVEVYERCTAGGDPASLLAAARAGRIDVVVVTSGDALSALFETAGESGRDAVTEMSMLVVSERIAALATSLGVRHAPKVATGASRVEILEALKQWKEAEYEQRRRAH